MKDMEEWHYELLLYGFDGGITKKQEVDVALVPNGALEGWKLVCMRNKSMSTRPGPLEEKILNFGNNQTSRE